MPAFDILQSGLYDDVFKPSLETVPFTGLAGPGKLLFIVQTTPGTYPVSIEIEGPDGEVRNFPQGVAEVNDSGRHAVICSWPIGKGSPGIWHIYLVIGGSRKPAVSVEF